MKKLRVILSTLAITVCLSACGQGGVTSASLNRVAEPRAASSKDFGDYVLHYNSMSTDQLTPSIAQEYNIKRGKNRAMLTVSIIKKTEDPTGVSVPGTVTATAYNLTGQVKNLNIRQISDGDAFYYVGDVSVAKSETLVFDIEAIPVNGTHPLALRFTRQYLWD